MENKPTHERKSRSKRSLDYNSTRATKRYRAGVQNKIESGAVGPAARKAERAVEGLEAAELDRAAKNARSGPASVRESTERAIERAENEGMSTARSDADRSPDVEDVEREKKRSS